MKRVIVCGLLTLLFAAACLLLRLGAARTQTVRTQYPAVAQERSNAFHTISSAPCCFPGTSAVAAQCRTPILANCCGLYAMPS